jgi:undecaprenyl pyrophosphate phosphatase UppP
MGGTLLESAKVIAHPPESFSFGPCFVGFFAALSLGLIIVPRALRFLEKGNLKPFAWYCLLAGILVTLILR